ncbi:MAG TPA: hypothetical protein VGB66_05975 [Longimicrobium sp.]
MVPGTQQLADLQQLDEGAGPAMEKKHGGGMLPRAPQMDEVNARPADIRGEVRMPVQFGLRRSPAEPAAPGGDEGFERRARQAAAVGDARRPARSGESPFEVLEITVTDVDRESLDHDPGS